MAGVWVGNDFNAWMCERLFRECNYYVHLQPTPITTQLERITINWAQRPTLKCTVLSCCLVNVGKKIVIDYLPVRVMTEVGRPKLNYNLRKQKLTNIGFFR